MRRAIFWTGWAIVFLLPIAIAIEIFMTEDMPVLHLWKWAIPLAAIALIFLGRNHDDVLKHHIG